MSLVLGQTPWLRLPALDDATEGNLLGPGGDGKRDRDEAWGRALEAVSPFWEEPLT